MPEVSDAMKRQLHSRRVYLTRRHNDCVRIINKLEPLASAMEREDREAYHPAMAQVFREQVRDAKAELLKINTTRPGFNGSISEHSEL